MAKYYKDDIKEALPEFKQAFPDGLTPRQVQAIDSMLRATINVRNNNTMNYAIKEIFPDAKFKMEHISGTYKYGYKKGQSYAFDKPICIEGVPPIASPLKEALDEKEIAEGYSAKESDALEEIPPHKEKLNFKSLFNNEN